MRLTISPTNLAFELIIQENFNSNEVSWTNFNAYKIILNWQPGMNKAYWTLCHTIQGVIASVIPKSDERKARLEINYEHVHSLNCTT